MRTEINGHRVIVYPEGRIDSSNAADLQKELEAVRAANNGCELELDAGGLEYISSAEGERGRMRSDRQGLLWDDLPY